MKRKAFWIGLLVGVGLSLLVGLVLVPVTGILPMNADGMKTPLDLWGHVAWETSLLWRAPGEEVPQDADLDEGKEHYNDMCVLCHGAPDRERDEWAHDMLPAPPELWTGESAESSDGQLFYTVKHGIRMTGMPAFGPTHSDEKIWDIVAYVKTLKK